VVLVSLQKALKRSYFCKVATWWMVLENGGADRWVCNKILDQILDHSKNLFDWNQNFTFSPNFVQFRPLYNFLSNSADTLTELETSKSLTWMRWRWPHQNFLNPHLLSFQLLALWKITPLVMFCLICNIFVLLS